MTVRVAGALATALTFAVSEQVHAQTVAGDAAISEALSDIRSLGGNGRAIGLLRTSSERFSARAKAMLADSLVAVAIDADTSRLAHRAALAAVSALANSGASFGSGSAFDGSGEALWQIATSERSRTKGAAVSGMTAIADSSERILRLTSVAELDARIAEMAIGILHFGLGEAGLAALRELHRRRTVTNRFARDQLETYAVLYGWAANPPPRRH